jgi:5'-nucleotidase / UDP-sugar diphosphatase
MPYISLRLYVCSLLFVLTTGQAKPTEEDHLSLVFAANMPDIALVEQGSYAQLASLLTKVRQENDLSLFAFGGGSLGPSPLASLDRGSHIIDILNTLEPDLMALSKREFSYFEDELTLRSYEAAFPFIASNVYDPLTKGNLEGVVTNLVINKGAIKLGFIAILDEDVVSEYLLSRVEVSEPSKLLPLQIKKLRQQGADIVVLIFSKARPYYQTLFDNKELDLGLQIASYDNIAAEHDSLNSASIFSFAQDQLAININLSWPKGEPNKMKAVEQPNNLTALADNPTTALLIEEYDRRLNRLLNQPIGRLNSPMSTLRNSVRTEEVAFGNLVADILREESDTDIAIINGGSIRGDRRYTADTMLTRGDIMRELPFRTRVAKLKLVGSELLAMLEYGLSEVELQKGRFPQVSGLTLRYDITKPAGQRITEIKINGSPLDNAKNYTLATTDYLAKGGDGYTMLQSVEDLNPIHSNTLLVSDIVMRVIQNKQTISPKVENRIVADKKGSTL